MIKCFDVCLDDINVCGLVVNVILDFPSIISDDINCCGLFVDVYT